MIHKVAGNVGWTQTDERIAPQQPQSNTDEKGWVMETKKASVPREAGNYQVDCAETQIVAAQTQNEDRDQRWRPHMTATTETAET